MKGELRHEYKVTSERAWRRNRDDECRNTLCTNKVMEVGDTIVMDGLTWFVEEVVK